MLTEAMLVKQPGAGFNYQEIIVDDDLWDNEVLVEMRATGVYLVCFLRFLVTKV
jgi:aryl-alcohol dehydrogenase